MGGLIALAASKSATGATVAVRHFVHGKDLRPELPEERMND